MGSNRVLYEGIGWLLPWGRPCYLLGTPPGLSTNLQVAGLKPKIHMRDAYLETLQWIKVSGNPLD